MTATVHREPAPVRGWLTGVRELALVAALFGAYKLGRLLALGDESLARRHAALVRTMQEWLHLPDEAAIQALLDTDLLRAANVYYVSMHFTVVVAFLLWGFLRRPAEQYVWARNLLAVQTTLALAIHVAFPLAPPRMFPTWGFLDTMTALGPSAYDGASATLANQLAAMPRLHVGWAAVVAYVLVRTAPRWLATAGVGHLLVTAVVVVVTANHWWLDGLVSLGLLAAAAAVLPGPGLGWRLPFGIHGGRLVTAGLRRS